MADLSGGISQEQQVKIVAQDETAINASIATEAASSWIVQDIKPDGTGTNVIILFTRATSIT